MAPLAAVAFHPPQPPRQPTQIQKALLKAKHRRAHLSLVVFPHSLPSLQEGEEEAVHLPCPLQHPLFDLSNLRRLHLRSEIRNPTIVRRSLPPVEQEVRVPQQDQGQDQHHRSRAPHVDHSSLALPRMTETNGRLASPTRLCSSCKAPHHHVTS